MQGIKDWWLKFAPRCRLIVQFIKFYAFSMLMMMPQYLVLMFLPGVFYWFTDWCDTPCQLIHLAPGPTDIYVFNYPITRDTTGSMGYFAAFAITLLLAWCINFPMQRNITFRSRGNVYYRVAWHAAASVLTTVACSFLVGLYVPFCKQYSSPAAYNTLITVINSGMQMAVCFPIYRVIFPESETKSGR